MKTGTEASVYGLAMVMVATNAFCWTYSLNAWLMFLGHSAVVQWWQGALIGLVPYFGHLSLPLAAGTWLLLLFLRG